MSEPNPITVENKNIVIKPLKTVPTQNLPIFINKNNKFTLLSGQKNNEFFKNVKFSSTNMFKEDIIYESKQGDFIMGNPHQKVTVINRLNLTTNCSRTIAKYTDAHGLFFYEKSSDRVAKLIGQSNYDTVFSALCSVISQEMKVRGIMALLTDNAATPSSEEWNTENQKSTQTELNKNNATEEKCSQTEENCMDLIYKMKQRKRIKRSVLTPYVVKDLPKKIKRVVVDPISFPTASRTQDKTFKETEEPHTNLTELHLSDDSNNGSLDNLSHISGYSNENLLNNPEQLFKSIQQPPLEPPNFSPTIVTMLDGSQIVLPVKPEDRFHYATPDILKRVTLEQRKKLLWYQAYIDWKYCLEKDEFGFLPIHRAVLDDDIDLLRRQCLVRRNRQESLDVPIENKTPLQMSIQVSPQCTAMLLQYGADPLFTDDEQRTCLHLAAEVSNDHLRTVVDHCQSNARDIFEDHEELWKKEYEMKSKEELGKILLEYICHMVDSQGYTPLMTASKVGNYTNVKTLLEASPTSVNLTMPNSGNTALLLAVGESCVDASLRGNKSTVSDRFRQTISILVENGADASIENHAGTNVHLLVQESNNSELSLLIANKLISVRYLNGEQLEGTTCESFMLIKNEDSKIYLAESNKSKPKTYKSKAVNNSSQFTIENEQLANSSSHSTMKHNKGDPFVDNPSGLNTNTEPSDDIKSNLVVKNEQLVKSSSPLTIKSDQVTNLSHITVPCEQSGSNLVFKPEDIKQKKETVKEKPIILENITLPKVAVLVNPSVIASNMSSNMKIQGSKIVTVVPRSEANESNKSTMKIDKIEKIEFINDSKSFTVTCSADDDAVKIENETSKRKATLEAGLRKKKKISLEDI